MQITDTIADLLTRIRNANSAKHDSVEIPASNLKKSICQICRQHTNYMIFCPNRIKVMLMILCY